MARVAGVERSVRGSGSKGLVLVVLVSVLLVAGAASDALGGGRRKVATLREEGKVFWKGERLQPEPKEESPLPELPPLPVVPQPRSSAEACGSDCYEYVIGVSEAAERLRVAVDTPDCDSAVTIELIDPHGQRRGLETSCYSAELYARSPALGDWIVRATASGRDPVFRMRAKLEGSKKAGPKRALLPNLRVESAHDFSYDSKGVGLASSTCFEEEVVEEGAQRCLRFAVGPQNTGAGPLELKFARDAEVGADASMTQRIHYSDGSTEMRPAGESEFHKAHAHFHLKGFASFTLFKVTDRQRGDMKAVANGKKAGFCLVDMRIARWKRFDQARSFTARSNCMPVGGKAEVGLSAGWTDIYGPELSGNYIDMGDNGDGFYVLRTVVDTGGVILESNERDNVGYAYIEIRGDSVKLLERGRGKSPWDPKRSVSIPWWRN